MKTLKTIFVLAVIILFSEIAFGQTKQSREVANFSEISVSDGISLELTMGDKHSVEVIADEDVIDRVITEVSGEKLKVHMKSYSFKISSHKVIVKVTAKNISEINTSGGASLITQNLVESDELELSASSGSNIKVAFKSINSSCDVSSGASASLKGSTKNFEAEASSGSNLNAKELHALNVEADASSGAHISVNVTESLEAEASSGGSVKYSGEPKLVDIDKSSGGSVKHKK